MRRGPWWIPFVCGWLVACGRDGDPGEGVFSARAPDGPLPAEDVVALADGVAPTDRAVADAAALRVRLKELAVASECLRRGNTPPEAIASTMLALYRTHGIDLETYTREMGRLGGDAAFQAEVQAALAQCPTVADAAIVGDADVVDTDDGEVAVAAADGVADAPETGDDAVPPAEDPSDAGAIDESPQDVVAAVDEADVVENKNEPEGETNPADAGPDWSGTWTGAIRGGATGTLRVSVRVRAITSATLTLGAKSVRLHGSISSAGQMALAGRITGGGFMRLRGRIDKSGKNLQGTWDGMVDGRNVQGAVSLSR